MTYSLKRSVAWNLSGYLYLLVASFISTPIIVQALGYSDFGRYGLILATLALISSLDLGLPQAVIRAYARTAQTSQKWSLWVTARLMFLLLGAVGALTIFGIVLIITQNFALALYSALLGFLQTATVHYTSLPQSAGAFGISNLKTFIVGTANTLLAAILAFYTHDLSLILLFQVIAYLLTLLILQIYNRRYLPVLPKSPQPRLTLAKALLAFGLPNQLGKLANQISAQYAKFLLAPLSPFALSAYLITQGLHQKAVAVISQLSISLYPAASQGSGLRHYSRFQFYSALIGVLGVVVVFSTAEPILLWWLGDPVLATEVNSLLQIAILAFAVQVLTPLAATTLEALGHPELPARTAVWTMVLEVTLAVLLLPHYGARAPLLGSLAALVITTPILLLWTRRTLSLKVQ